MIAGDANPKGNIDTMSHTLAPAHQAAAACWRQGDPDGSSDAKSRSIRNRGRARHWLHSTSSGVIPVPHAGPEGRNANSAIDVARWHKEPGGCQVAREAFYDTVYEPELVFVRVLEVRFSIEAFFRCKIPGFVVKTKK